MIRRMLPALLALLMALGVAASAQAGSTAALAPQPLPPKAVAVNPYMGVGDNSIHNDVYSTDVTDAVAPLGIYSRVSTSIETLNAHAPSAAFYDSRGNAITPLMGGISIVDMDGDEIQRLGSFVPQRDDAGGYAFQISYSFVDSNDNVVAPTSHGHIVIMRTMDESGAVLPVFEKILDIDVVGAAVEALGDDIDQSLLSIAYDYQGNLWFVTGGFRVYPDRDPAGFIGYISREYMQSAAQDPDMALADNIYFYRLDEGEGAENGMAANPHGTVILTNMACYMLVADDGVQVSWRTPYQSNGANDAQEGSIYTGGGLAWGSGTSPTLTSELVIFTDNQDPINLLALSCKTGEVVAQLPVLDALGEDVPVTVENSILVYDSGDGGASVVVANWFGAGNSGLADPDADSSIQSYDNIYDANWMQSGNAYIAPGVERVDFVKGEDGYTARKVWSRADISETAMIKLSTATGYLYGYWQDAATGMWRYEVLDFDTGETLLCADVSSLAGYNNVAVGLITDPKGNALYCPTNAMEMVCWQDEIAYLPECPGKAIPLANMERYRVDAADIDLDGLNPASYLMTVSVDNLCAGTALALRVNGLSAAPDQYALLYRDADGAYCEVQDGWTLCDESGNVLTGETALQPDAIYEIRLAISDGADVDLNAQAGDVTVSALLAIKAG